MAEQVKRKRGRPRKNPLPEEVNTLVQETISKQKAPPKQEIKEEIPEIKKEIPKKESKWDVPLGQEIEYFS